MTPDQEASFYHEQRLRDEARAATSPDAASELTSVYEKLGTKGVQGLGAAPNAATANIRGLSELAIPGGAKPAGGGVGLERGKQLASAGPNFGAPAVGAQPGGGFNPRDAISHLSPAGAVGDVVAGAGQPGAAREVQHVGDALGTLGLGAATAEGGNIAGRGLVSLFTKMGGAASERVAMIAEHLGVKPAVVAKSILTGLKQHVSEASNAVKDLAGELTAAAKPTAKAAAKPAVNPRTGIDSRMPNAGKTTKELIAQGPTPGKVVQKAAPKSAPKPDKPTTAAKPAPASRKAQRATLMAKPGVAEKAAEFRKKEGFNPPLADLKKMAGGDAKPAAKPAAKAPSKAVASEQTKAQTPAKKKTGSSGFVKKKIAAAKAGKKPSDLADSVTSGNKPKPAPSARPEPIASPVAEDSAKGKQLGRVYYTISSDKQLPTSDRRAQYTELIKQGFQPSAKRLAEDPVLREIYNTMKGKQ